MKPGASGAGASLPCNNPRVTCSVIKARVSWEPPGVAPSYLRLPLALL